MTGGWLVFAHQDIKSVFAEICSVLLAVLYLGVWARAASCSRCGDLAAGGFGPYFGHAWFAQRRFYGKPSAAYLLPRQPVTPSCQHVSMAPFWQTPVVSCFRVFINFVNLSEKSS